MFIWLQLRIYNHRNEAIKLWWVNYSGSPVLYGVIPSVGALIRQLTFGTHPWLITNTDRDLITSVTPNTSDMEVTIE
jgi:hypothetical protein